MTLYAIVQGGMIQDASSEVECIDLDWMESDHDIPDLDELERQRDILALAISEGSFWQGELAEIENAIAMRIQEEEEAMQL